jgi:hypothetical protein
MAPALVGSPSVEDTSAKLKDRNSSAPSTGTTATEEDGTIPTVVEVDITTEERASGVMSKQNIEKAIVALAEDGVVVLNGAVEEEALDLLNGLMVKEAK